MSTLLKKLQSNISLRSLNTFGVEAIAHTYLPIDSAEELPDLPELIAALGLPVMILGGGSNLVLGARLECLVLHMRIQGVEFFDWDDRSTRVRAAAGVVWHELVTETVRRGLYGLENLSLIPGSVGAAPVQNIGAYGAELADCFYELEAIDLQTGEQRCFDAQSAQFGYRESVFKRGHAGRWLIIAVTLTLSKLPSMNLEYGGLSEAISATEELPNAQLVSRVVSEIRRTKLPDPAVLGNAGSFFKNPVISEHAVAELKQRYPDLPVYALAGGEVSKIPAAWLIEKVGLKGLRRGDVAVSDKHALVLVNYGLGSGRDILNLANEVIEIVYEQFGIRLEAEPRILVSSESGQL